MHRKRWIIVVAGAALVLNVNAATPGTGAAGRPYNIQYGRAVDTSLYTNLGPARYNSLQAQLDRRFSAGILIKASYTYGKAMNWTSAKISPKMSVKWSTSVSGTGLPFASDTWKL